MTPPPSPDDTGWLKNTTPVEVVNMLKVRDRKISDLESSLRQLEAQNRRLKKSLDKCVKWIKPVMDGFGLPKDAESRIKVLEFAQSALEEEKDD